MSQPLHHVDPALRFILTIWRMMQQTLSEVVREHPASKPERRYAVRAGLNDRSVNVIQLRRRRPPHRRRGTTDKLASAYESLRGAEERVKSSGVHRAAQDYRSKAVR